MQERNAASEAQTQKAVCEFLSARKIWWMRCNTGAMQAEHNGKRRFLRFGKPGMADIQAISKFDFQHTVGPNTYWATMPRVIWLEIKSPTGKQSAAQKEFQAEVEAEGHTYLLVRDINEVIEFFGG